MKHKFAAQLYSLRKDLTVDFVKVLKKGFYRSAN